MGKPFTFDEKMLKILANFATINPSMIIQPDKLAVKNTANSCVGIYNFPTSFDFDEFGLYETPAFLSAISIFDDQPQIEVKNKSAKDTYLQINGKTDKMTYWCTPLNILEDNRVPDVKSKFASVKCNLEFTLTADKLAIINKTASILRSKYMFFETDGKKVRITIANELESSNNSYELFINDGIKTNKLSKPVKLEIEDFKVLPGEYNIQLTENISCWSNLNGVDYFIATSV